MTTSMTGFGSSSLKTDQISINTQVKSVNGRFLEMRFRMPRDYGCLEGEIRKLIGKQIQRGTVDLSIFRTYESKTADIKVIPNLALAKAWKKGCDELQKELSLPQEVYQEYLTKAPDLLQIGEQDTLLEWEVNAVIRSVQEALDSCLAEKNREGGTQNKILNELLTQIQNFINSVKEKKDIIKAQLQEKLVERLKVINEAITVDPQRLSQEVLFLVDKADIEEELKRAQAHIAACQKTLSQPGSIGKKIEFYIQELHREVNTMGAKTQSLSVTLDVIEAKTCIERMREQVQNIE